MYCERSGVRCFQKKKRKKRSDVEEKGLNYIAKKKTITNYRIMNDK